MVILNCPIPQLMLMLKFLNKSNVVNQPVSVGFGKVGKGHNGGLPKVAKCSLKSVVADTTNKFYKSLHPNVVPKFQSDASKSKKFMDSYSSFACAQCDKYKYVRTGHLK